MSTQALKRDSSLKYGLSLQAGLSLIELLIALSLSLTLTLGVVEFFTQNKRSIALIHDANELLDNAQLSLAMLAEDIQMADYWGGIEGEDLDLAYLGLKSYPGACDAAWVLNVSEGIRGFEGQESANDISGLPRGCLGKGYVSHSDVLVLRYASAREVVKDALVDNKSNENRYFIRSELGLGGYVFKGGQHASAFKHIPKSTRALNRELSVSLFFIEPCTEQDYCERRGSSLSRYTLEGDRFKKQRLVNGVEQMQLEYGLDEDGDSLVERYAIAHQVSDWRSVKSLRLYLLLRGNQTDQSKKGLSKGYSLGDLSAYTYTPEGRSEAFRYRIFKTEISLKNRSH